MNKYIKPEIEIQSISVQQIIATSLQATIVDGSTDVAYSKDLDIDFEETEDIEGF